MRLASLPSKFYHGMMIVQDRELSRLLVLPSLVCLMISLMFGSACGGESPPSDAGKDMGVDTSHEPCTGPPGLYAEGNCVELAPGVEPFAPAHRLWSDGIKKDRFVYLPPGGKIDTTDPDAWVFPVGTRAYKNFSSGTTKLETRRFEKMSEGEGWDKWSITTYEWNAAQDQATEVVGGKNDVLGTAHDIPDHDTCVECHSRGTPDTIVGISALLMNHQEEGLTLTKLRERELLTMDVTDAAATFPGNISERKALGYLHVNCGICHGGATPQGDFTMWVKTSTPTVADTDTYKTGVGQPSAFMPMVGGMVKDTRIVAGSAADSVAFIRMSSRVDGEAMPPVGTEIKDDQGLSAVANWINALP